MKGRQVILAGPVLLLVCSPVLAHGFVVSPSTPVSPPIGYEWLAVATLAAIFLANVLLPPLFRIARWRAAIAFGVLATAMFVAAFYYAGRFHGGISTAPPGAPGTPEPIFWGLGWGDVGFTFVAWNITGALILPR